MHLKFLAHATSQLLHHTSLAHKPLLDGLVHLLCKLSFNLDMVFATFLRLNPKP